MNRGVASKYTRDNPVLDARPVTQNVERTITYYRIIDSQSRLTRLTRQTLT